MLKVSLFLLFLLSFATISVTAETAADRTDKLRSASPALSAYWPADSVVKVYFVRNLFLPQEKQAIWETIEAWQRNSRKQDTGITFVYEGETNGLIDCRACLTITRQEVYVSNSQHRALFNRLRYDERGHLFSAWIGIDLSVNSSRSLKDLILKALDRGLVVQNCSTEYRAHVTV